METKSKDFYLIAILCFLIFTNSVHAQNDSINRSDKISAISASISISVPNGGEQLPVRKDYKIIWSVTGVSTINIEYSVDGGTNWATIVTNLSYSPYSYMWTVPNIPSANCLLRISDSTNPAVNDVSDNVFTIFNPLLVTAPNGGEDWYIGRTHNITWNSTDVDSVKIECSFNNGLDWVIIESSVPAASGSYPWTVPDTPSKKCLIRLLDVADSNTGDYSDAVFTILYQLTVTAPNGGENWGTGRAHEIKWNSTGINTVRIELSQDGGSNWEIIVPDVTYSNLYLWRVTGIASANCLMKINDHTEPNVNDKSDNVFTIFHPITVISPNGGENWGQDITYDITWSSTDVNTVKIEYSPDDGSVWETIVSEVEASSGLYTWAIPDTSGTQFLVRISDTSDPYVNDQSDNMFSITVLPEITVVSPDGGEEWVAGISQDITWTSRSVNDVRIEFSADNGLNWGTIVSDVADSLRSYSWTVPDTSSTQCLVKISDKTNINVNDQSEAAFVIRSLLPPVNVEVTDFPDDDGHRLMIFWSLSPDDEIITSYKIFRSRNPELTEPLNLTDFNSFDELMEAEQNSTIFITSVPSGQTSYIDIDIPITGVDYYYWIQAVSDNSSSEKAASGLVTIVESQPLEFRVSSPYPNPFNPATAILYEIPMECHVKLLIYDIIGRKVAVLQDGVVSAGVHEAVWFGKDENGSILGSGVYLYHFKAGDYSAQGKMMFLR